MLYLRRGEVTPPYGTELRYVLKAPIISGPFSFAIDFHWMWQLSLNSDCRVHDFRKPYKIPLPGPVMAHGLQMNACEARDNVL